MLKKLIKFSASYTFIEGIQKGIVFFITPIITRYMSSEEYGIVATILMLIPFYIVFFSLSIHSAIARYYFKYKNSSVELRNFLGTSIILIALVSFSISIFLYLIGKPFFIYFLPSIQFSPYIVYSLIIASSQVIVIAYFSLLKSMQKLKLYIWIFNLYFSTQITLILYLVIILKLNAYGYILSLVISNVAFMLIVLVLIKKDINLCLKTKYIKEILSYSLPIIPVDGIGLVSSLADRYYLLKFVGLSSVGVYFVGYQLALVISLINRAINSAYVPIFFNRYESDNNNYDDIYRIGEYFVYFSGFLALFSSIAAPDLIYLLFDESYYKASEVIVYLNFSFSLTSIYFLNTNVLSLEAEYIKLKTIGIIVGAIITVLLSYYMTKYYALVGASVSTLIGFFITTLILIMIVRLKTDFKFKNLKSIIFLISCFSISEIALLFNKIYYSMLIGILLFIITMALFEYKVLLRRLNGNFNIK